MRIDRLTVKNFRGFSNSELVLHPNFSLVVGENGAGKTAVLEALSISAGSWFLGLRGFDTRHIRSDDVRLKGFTTNDGTNWESQYPCVVEAQGKVLGKHITWRRSLNFAGGRTTYGDARSIKDLAAKCDEQVKDGDTEFSLPIISYYGTGRLWNIPREHAKVSSGDKIKRKESLSRLTAYRNSVDPRLSVSDLVEWFARQSWMTFQNKGVDSPPFSVAKKALTQNIQNAKDVYFDAALGEVIVEFCDGIRQPFNNLSDGQRCMLALVGDIARKAAALNPHLRGRILLETPGIVMIDELDLHLHPKWQRQVIEDLRTTFPKLQFVCTTHSPYLIQSLRSGEELVMLDGQPMAQLGDLSLGEIAQGIQGVLNPQVSARYNVMKDVARNYLETLEEAAKAPKDKLAEYQERLAESIAPYADNPAFQAFLEMKRATKLGE